MDVLNYQKVARNNDYELLINKTGNYMVLTFFGMWNASSELDHYLEDVKKAIENLSPGFHLIVDLRAYRGSESAYIPLHVKAQSLALQSGLKKTVVVMQDNPLLKLTAEYIFKQSGISPVYINNMNAAESWLAIYTKKQ